MPGEIRVPELGESVVDVTVQRWLKAQGEQVQEGELLVELETEKANVEIVAEQSGVLTAIARQEGETVSIGEVLGAIGEAVAAPQQPPPDEASAAASTQTGDGSVREAARRQPQVTTAPPETRDGSESEAREASLARHGVHSAPAARRFATENDVDLEDVKGTGPGGRILKEDVVTYLELQQDVESAPPAPEQAPAPTPVAPAAAQQEGRERRVPMSRRRQTIARRLVEAQRNAAMLTTFNEVDMSTVVDVRKRRRDAFRERHGVGLGYMSFFTKATVGALKEFPRLNAEIQGNEILLKEYYDIGIAVGVEDGLVVPVVRDADRKSFAQLEKDVADLARKARESKLSLAELQGGTFTITNGGIYGSLLSTPILNAPQVGILGMHAMKERPVVVGGEIVVRPMMYLALSYDHRIVDGSDAVRFLVRIKEMIEDPETLLLEG